MGGVIQKPHMPCSEETEKDTEALSCPEGIHSFPSSGTLHLHLICITLALHLHCRMLGQEEAFFGKASSGQSDLLQGPKCSFLVVKITWLGQDPVDQLSCLALAVSSPKCVRLGSGRASIRSMGPDSTVGPPIY